ncbi:MAG: sulfatase-like hydrolase/transferase [Planctomycetes bacterium]|nr:sulfatase-like hydrolase/transferase [Planctomycetota bacterium]
MSRVVRALLGLSIVGVGFVAVCSRDAAPPRPDHVVLIVIDTLRADRTTPYGYGRDTSPNLARLAREGVLFENAVSQSSWTSPSMVSMMTGRYLAGERLSIPDDATTLAEGFQRAGFQTAAFVCNDILSDKTRFERGFQVFEQLEPYSDDGKIVQWLESSKGKKTFTWIHLAEPHDVNNVYGPPTEDHVKFKKEPAELSKQHVEFLQAYAKSHGLTDYDASVATIRRERSGYDDDVAYSDWRVGHFLAALERAGLYDRTAIVIAADHGEGLWTREAYDTGSRRTQVEHEHRKPTLLNLLMGTHGNQAYHELLHVPLIVKAPGVGPNVIVKSWVENVDIAPTLFELCDVAAPGVLQGKSLLALARAPNSDATRKVFSMTRFVSSVIDEHGMQLLVPTPDAACTLGLVPELYDLAADPESRRNLAAERPELVTALGRVIEQRLAVGLPGEMKPTPDELVVLKSLGYVGDDGNGIIETKPDLSQMPTEKLIEAASDAKLPCLARLQAAEALAGRAFDEPQRARLVDAAAKSDAIAVRAALEKALSP